MTRFRRIARKVAAPVTALLLATLPAVAQDTRAEVTAEITAMMGGVPSFVNQIADSALPGLWKESKMLEFSGDTALDSKTKALISLAVSAQIPCQYCVWMDTNSARQFGATDQEIAEAIAVAGLTRNWSTIFNGLQIDFATFKAELGGQ